MPDTRDVIARTLFEMDGIEPPVDRDHPIWHNYLTDAAVILAALAAKGLVIVEREDMLWLRALRAAGVDNWQGIDHAIDLLRDEMIAAEGCNDD